MGERVHQKYIIYDFEPIKVEPKHKIELNIKQHVWPFVCDFLGVKYQKMSKGSIHKDILNKIFNLIECDNIGLLTVFISQCKFIATRRGIVIKGEPYEFPYYLITSKDRSLYNYIYPLSNYVASLLKLLVMTQDEVYSHNLRVNFMPRIHYELIELLMHPDMYKYREGLGLDHEYLTSSKTFTQQLISKESY